MTHSAHLCAGCGAGPRGRSRCLPRGLLCLVPGRARKRAPFYGATNFSKCFLHFAQTPSKIVRIMTKSGMRKKQKYILKDKKLYSGKNWMKAQKRGNYFVHLT